MMLSLKIDKAGEGNCYPCMGCRSFLTTYRDENDKPKYYGRFNQGVVTLNLVDVACSSKGNVEAFWKIMDERLDLCYRALMCRHNRLLGTPSDVAPILWQDGALARLKKRRNDRQAALWRLLDDFARLRRSLRVRDVYDRPSAHRRAGHVLRSGNHAVFERRLRQVESPDEHRLLAVWNADGIDDV